MFLGTGIGSLAQAYLLLEEQRSLIDELPSLLEVRLSMSVT